MMTKQKLLNLRHIADKLILLCCTGNINLEHLCPPSMMQTLEIHSLIHSTTAIKHLLFTRNFTERWRQNGEQKQS